MHDLVLTLDPIGGDSHLWLDEGPKAGVAPKKGLETNWAEALANPDRLKQPLSHDRIRIKGGHEVVPLPLNLSLVDGKGAIRQGLSDALIEERITKGGGAA